MISFNLKDSIVTHHVHPYAVSGAMVPGASLALGETRADPAVFWWLSDIRMPYHTPLQSVFRPWVFFRYKSDICPLCPLQHTECIFFSLQTVSLKCSSGAWDGDSQHTGYSSEKRPLLISPAPQRLHPAGEHSGDGLWNSVLTIVSPSLVSAFLQCSSTRPSPGWGTESILLSLLRFC